MVSMKKSYLFLMLTMFLASCIKEDSTNYYGYLKNTTNHQIKITPYFSGALIQANIVTLSPNERKEIAYGSVRGLQNGGGFTSKYFSGSDSIIVTFDDLYPISHYLITPISLRPKYYLHSSTRNIGNIDSYQVQVKNLSAHIRENIFSFEFVEQDYLDAQ